MSFHCRDFLAGFKEKEAQSLDQNPKRTLATAIVASDIASAHVALSSDDFLRELGLLDAIDSTAAAHCEEERELCKPSAKPLQSDGELGIDRGSSERRIPLGAAKGITDTANAKAEPAESAKIDSPSPSPDLGTKSSEFICL